jgi:hypothetical protein
MLEITDRRLLRGKQRPRTACSVSLVKAVKTRREAQLAISRSQEPFSRRGAMHTIGKIGG